MYIHIHTYTYTHMYIYIYTHTMHVCMYAYISTHTSLHRKMPPKVHWKCPVENTMNEMT